MFLFEGQFGRILYTGDFRYSGPMLNDVMLNSLSGGSIDVLYLDNTFCDSRCIFPSRDEAIIEILQVIQSHPDAEIKIGLRSLGKEDMLVEVARRIGEWIGVSQDRYEILEILCMTNVFKVSSSCRIQAVMLSEITGKNMTDWNLEHQTVAIIPTALGVALSSPAFPPRDDVYVIPYSDHSSFEELQQFVSMVKPCKIIPILGSDVKDRLTHSLPNRADMSCFRVNVDGGEPRPVASELQPTASSSYNTNTDDSTVQTSQPKTSKTNTRKRCFPFKKKPDMGVVYTSSESPVKCVAASADSTDMTVELSNAECDADCATPTGVMCLDTISECDACDTTADSIRVGDQHYIQSGEVQNLQHVSAHVHSTSDDTVNGGIDNQSNNAVDWDTLDNASMLRMLEPLIAEEADRIIFEEQYFSGLR